MSSHPAKPGMFDLPAEWGGQARNVSVLSWRFKPSPLEVLFICSYYMLKTRHHPIACDHCPAKLIHPVATSPACRVGPHLLALDRTNFSGSFKLNLSLPLHRALAQRLQLAALQESAWVSNKFYISWRNATYNGELLKDEAMTKLQNYGIPTTGTLTLDYVSYQVRRYTNSTFPTILRSGNSGMPTLTTQDIILQALRNAFCL
jgi:hypothetical protein